MVAWFLAGESDIAMRFAVVQPYGHHAARESTVLSTHSTAEEAFAAVARIIRRAHESGTPFAMTEKLDLTVVNLVTGEVLRAPLH